MTWPEVARELDLDLMVLFGSQARDGTGRDTDLALLPRDSARVSEGWEAARALIQWTQRADLDVVWLPSSSWLLHSEVAREGQVLFEARPGCFQEFQSVAWLRRVDSECWRQAQSAFLTEFLEGKQGVNEDLIRERLTLMAQSLHELDPVLEGGREAFILEPMRHHTGERLLELLVECAAGINTEAGKSAGIAPTDYYSSFFTMVTAGWLDSETARVLADMAGLRNVVVHQYQRVNLGQLFDALTAAKPSWKLYVAAVKTKIE